MTGEPSQPTTSNRPGRGGDPIHTARMSFGDHLEELRSCLIRALMGVVLGMAVALLLGKEILEIVCRPLLAAQLAGGLPPRLQVLAPTAAFTAYLKIGLLSGLILSMPWVLAQGWRFVATGLYSHERRFAKLLVPSSLVLFAAGVLFLYFAVLPILFQFFIRFNQGFDALVPAATRQLEPGAAAPSPDAASTSPSGNTTAPFRIPQHADPPPDARVGDLWLDPATRRLAVQTPDGVWSVPLEPGRYAATMQSQFAIDFYVSFVLLLALAFGIAFETPIVVYFLSRTGIVPLKTMTGGRRYVLLGTVALAAILTPPDVISQLLLAGPMYLLFEVGILAVRIREGKAT